MKRLTYYYQTENRFDAPVGSRQFLLRLMPRMRAGQSVQSASVLLSPDVPYTLQRDAFGNLTQVGCVREAHDRFTYTAIGEVEVDHALPDRAPPHPMYRYPSPLTQLSSAMERFADESPDPSTPKGALALSGRVFGHFAYTPGVTDVSTGAPEAFDAARGVCQDYAHVLIALLRRAGVPARYACGLSVGEGVTHAWVQAYVDGRWLGLDPTRDTLTTEEYVVFAVGRDAGDCPLDRGAYLGAAEPVQTVFMRLMEQ